MKKSFSVIALMGVMGVLLGGRVSALTYQDDVNVQFTFNPVIRIDLSDSELLVSNLAPGAASDSNIITVSAATNASYGYQLSATVGTKSGTDALVNTLDNTKTFANLTTTKAGLVDFSDNTWGYSYCADTSANCGTGGTSSWVSGSVGETTAGYGGLPLDDNDDASLRGQGGVTLISTTGDGDNSSVVQFKIGAKAGTNQVAGTYNNTINFYAVANPEPQLEPVECEAGKICYNVNSLGPTEGTMGMQTQDDSGNAIADGSSVTLLASNFSRTGYGFAGWNTQPDYSGAFYGPQETITTPTGTATNGLSLYAVWVQSQGSLQDTAKVTNICNSLTTAPTTGANLTSVSALTDQRDNETYAIAKLADGNCWMIENLRLESTNSDNSTGALAQGYGTSSTYGNFSGLADAESTGFSSTYTANSLYYSGTQEGTASIDIGTSNYPAFRMPRYNNWNNQSTSANRPQNPTSNSATNSTTNAGMYSHGNYYTWHAAIADLTYNDTNNQSTTSTSLCPTGWRLPQGGDKTRIESNDDNDFWNLTVDALNGGTNPANYGSQTRPYYTGTDEAGPVANKLRSFPNNFLYSGFFYTSSAYGRGSYGYYWSSTADSYNYSYYLYLSSSSVYPGTDHNTKYCGYSIRCTVSAGT